MHTCTRPTDVANSGCVFVLRSLRGPADVTEGHRRFADEQFGTRGIPDPRRLLQHRHAEILFLHHPAHLRDHICGTHHRYFLRHYVHRLRATLLRGVRRFGVSRIDIRMLLYGSVEDSFKGSQGQKA